MMTINGFQLPILLESDLNEGRIGLSPAERDSLIELLQGFERPTPALFGQEGIRSANRLWTSEYVRSYLGNPSQVHAPGDIDPQKTLIIGQAEPDSPIALDYRIEPPRVVYFGDIDQETYWLEMAPTYDAFVSKFRK